jgi:hypothetical protein
MSGVFRDTDEGLRVRSVAIRAQLDQLKDDEKIATDKLREALGEMEAVSTWAPPPWRLRIFGISLVIGVLVNIFG